MFDLEFGSRRDCEGLDRRQLLRIGGLGLLGLGLPDLLRSRAAAETVGDKAGTGPQGADDLSVILLWMQGGPSHIDMFDPKPEAPIEIKGEFGVIDTVLPGVQLCEHLPRLARNLDKLSMIRSGYCYNASHGVADAYMLSGWRYTPSVVYPAFGSVVAKELGYRRGMPPYLMLGTAVDKRFNGGAAGYLGNEFNPFEIAEDPNRGASDKRFEVDGVTLPTGITLERFQRRRTMLAHLDVWQEQTEKASDSVAAMDSFYEKAVGIVTSPAAKRAFDIGREHPKVRDEYGRNRFGQSCLLARRLVQAGVRFVTVTDGGWDTHQNNFTSLKDHKLPMLDRAYSALVRDLASQGMLERTVVLWLGDFGRTPRVNPSAGRDHWAGSTVFCVGGGGIKVGEVLGRSNEYAEQPATDPVQVEDIGATLFHLLGVDMDRHYVTPDGRPIRVFDGGRVLRELLV